MVNFAIVNGRGTMGKRGSDDTKANCFPPPTEKQKELRIILLSNPDTQFPGWPKTAKF